MYFSSIVTMIRLWADWLRKKLFHTLTLLRATKQIAQSNKSTVFQACTQRTVGGVWLQSTSRKLYPLIKIVLSRVKDSLAILEIWYGRWFLFGVINNLKIRKTYPSIQGTSQCIFSKTRAGIYSGVWKDHRWARLSDLESMRLCSTFIRLQREKALWEGLYGSVGQP